MRGGRREEEKEEGAVRKEPLYIADNIAHILRIKIEAHVAWNALSHGLFPAIMFHHRAKQLPA